MCAAHAACCGRLQDDDEEAAGEEEALEEGEVEEEDEGPPREAKEGFVLRQALRCVSRPPRMQQAPWPSAQPPTSLSSDAGWGGVRRVPLRSLRPCQH